MGLFPLDFRQVVWLLFVFETGSTNLFMTIDLKVTDSTHIVMPDHILVTLTRHNTNRFFQHMLFDNGPLLFNVGTDNISTLINDRRSCIAQLIQ